MKDNSKRVHLMDLEERLDAMENQCRLVSSRIMSCMATVKKLRRVEQNLDFSKKINILLMLQN
jgi:hypothetical protein